MVVHASLGVAKFKVQDGANASIYIYRKSFQVCFGLTESYSRYIRRSSKADFWAEKV